MTTISLSEQEIIRRNSLKRLREMGIDPYPAAQYPVNALASEIKKGFSPEANNFQEVCIAGRLMGQRIMGKGFVC
jgi:lysyl-tRNA synthetase, class II